MNLPHRFENAEAIGEVYFIRMLFDQVVHHQVMGGAADNADIVVVCKLNDFFVIGDILGRLPGIPKTGQTVGSDAGDIIFYYGNNGRHG
jgi:hypothetical protein